MNIPPNIPKTRAVLILHNIRSTHNVGSVFRTADAAGVEKIYISGYTPAPLDRFGRIRSDIGKTALGAEISVPWEEVKSISQLVSVLQKNDFEVVAVEQDKRAVDYKVFKPKRKVALLFGNEVRGVSKAVLKKCDAVIEIPMRGKKESLNVSVAAGIIIFRVLGV